MKAHLEGPKKSEGSKKPVVTKQHRRRSSSVGDSTEPPRRQKSLAGQPPHVKKRLGVESSDDIEQASAYRVRKFFGEELDPKQVTFPS